jgi:hypothetical protein
MSTEKGKITYQEKWWRQQETLDGQIRIAQAVRLAVRVLCDAREVVSNLAHSRITETDPELRASHQKARNAVRELLANLGNGITSLSEDGEYGFTEFEQLMWVCDLIIEEKRAELGRAANAHLKALLAERPPLSNGASPAATSGTPEG